MDELLEKCAEYTHDPLGFVMWNYSWGEGELAAATGPEYWQTECMMKIKLGLMTVDQAILLAISSGNGIGKSAFVSWLLDWAQSTFEDCMGIVTANTETQLKTKTWAEFSRWHRRGLTRVLFKFTATARYSIDPLHEKTWRIDMIAWSENNSEAFSGLHNLGKRIILIFDEASGIPDIIWESASGFLTDRNTEIIWFCAGNPWHSTGRFRECFPGGKEEQLWFTLTIDSRTSTLTNKRQLNEWIESWGLDSDYVRVHVLGQFPKIGLSNFIPRDAVVEAQKREILVMYDDAVVLGVDVARFGDDAACIYPRKGRDCRTLPYRMFMGLDLMAFSDVVVALAKEYEADAIFIDGTGVGGGVVDRCRRMGLDVFDVQFGARAARLPGDGTVYMNKRAEMWGSLRLALPGLSLPTDQPLLEELCGVEYGLNIKGEIQLESKKEMKARGLPSPNRADALALTYAYPVLHKKREGWKGVVGVDYDPYALEAA